MHQKCFKKIKINLKISNIYIFNTFLKIIIYIYKFLHFIYLLFLILRLWSKLNL